MDPSATGVHNFTSGLGSTPAVLLNHSFFISGTCQQTFLSSLIWRRSSLAWHPSIPQLNLPPAPTPCCSPSCLITVPKGSFTAAGPDSALLSSSSQSFFLYSFTCCHPALCRCACLLPVHAGCPVCGNQLQTRFLGKTAQLCTFSALSYTFPLSTGTCVPSCFSCGPLVSKMRLRPGSSSPFPILQGDLAFLRPIRDAQQMQGERGGDKRGCVPACPWSCVGRRVWRPRTQLKPCLPLILRPAVCPSPEPR